MKPLSFSLLGCLLVLSLSSANSPKTISPATTTTPMTASTLRWMIAQPCFTSVASAEPHSVTGKRDLSYYWYTYPDDIYNDYNTIASEAWNLWVLLGGIIVDTNNLGGTLLEKGYIDYGEPHLFPSAFLYAHYGIF